jgi:hypothetical protein
MAQIDPGRNDSRQKRSICDSDVLEMKAALADIPDKGGFLILRGLRDRPLE